MSDAIKADNAKYAAFAASMIACEAAAVAEVARWSANERLVNAYKQAAVATIRPSK